MLKKFESLINHYNKKDVEYLIFNTAFYHKQPIVDLEWVAIEKIDGANFQIEIKNGNVRFGTRNEYLHCQTFFNYQEAMSFTRVVEMISHMKSLKQDMIIYGELFGKGIQNRIDYGDLRQFRVFDVQFIDGENVTKFAWRNVRELMTGFEDLLVNEIARVNSYEECMALNIDEMKSTILNKEDNFVEGVVLRPMDFSMDTYVKFKTQAFNEKMVKPKKDSKVVEYTDAQNQFRQYVNENRMYSLFSKIGNITSTKQMSEYIKLLMQDAYDDYIKDGGVDCEIKCFNACGSKLLMDFIRKAV